MKRLIVLGILILAATLVAATNVTSRKNCSTYALTVGQTIYFAVGQAGTMNALDISLEPDATGAGVTATVALQHCSRETAASCQAFTFDTDGDGVGDTNVMTGAVTYAIEKVGVRGITGFNFLQVIESGMASTVPELTVCRRSI